MNIHEFSKTIKCQLRNYIHKLNKNICSRQLRISLPYYLPTSIRIAETPTQFIAELIGARPPTRNSIYSLDTLSPEILSSGSDYFCPGFSVLNPIRGVIHDTHHAGISNLAVVTKYDHALFHKKLGINLPYSQLQMIDSNMPLWIGPNADVVTLKDVSILRAEEQRVLFRFISSAVIFQKSHTVDSMMNELNNHVLRNWPTFGLMTDSPHQATSLARQIHSFADQQIKEKVLDKFLREHAHEFARGLGKRSAKFQVRLEWQHQVNPALKVSIPDFMMEREDGYYDILDLKQGLRRSRLTRGNPARLKYRADVDDSIAQLETYAEYFDFEENRRWAEKHYGIRTKNINVIGVIGNYDSIDSASMLRLKQRKPNLILVDYNSLANLIGAIG